MIATFMKASTPLEAYSQEGGQLSERDLSSIELTVSGLVSFLATWKRTHTTLMMSSDAFAVSPSFRKAHKKTSQAKSTDGHKINGGDREWVNNAIGQ